jgi:hypothetical protein
MRQDNFLAENNDDKATVFANHLATQCVPPAYLVFDEVLCELTSLLTPRNSLSQSL